jgi:hypothetical protein
MVDFDEILQIDESQLEFEQNYEFQAKESVVIRGAGNVTMQVSN